MILQPEAPSGWPNATAPPKTTHSRQSDDTLQTPTSPPAHPIASEYTWGTSPKKTKKSSSSLKDWDWKITNKINANSEEKEKE